MGLAATRFAPALNAQAAPRKIGYAIIGLGRIANIYMRGVPTTTNSTIAALVSGHRDKADRIAAQYGVPSKSIYNYDNFDEIVHNPAIDAVYVALPNSMHAEYAIRAAKAGKHVLCEKPMATTIADAESMMAACKAANVKLMIAYRCHYEATHLRAAKLIRDGAIGQVQSIQSAFGFYEVAGEWRLNKKLAGGGPLVDVGIYSLNACRFLTGEEPTDFSAHASVIDHDGRFDTVEENLSWTMKFPSGIIASCATTYGAPMDGYLRVYGSKGTISLDPAYNYDGLHLRAQIGRTQLDEPSAGTGSYQFQAEAEHFSNCILTGKEPQSGGDEGIRDMRYIKQIYHSAGISYSE